MFVLQLAMPRRSAGLRLLHRRPGSKVSIGRVAVATRCPRAAPDFPSLMDARNCFLEFALCSRYARLEKDVLFVRQAQSFNSSLYRYAVPDQRQHVFQIGWFPVESLRFEASRFT